MTRSKDSEYETHEAFGMAGLTRVSGYNDRMFGSDVPHNGWIELTVYKGAVKRDLNQEWFSEDGQHVVVQLTHSQFSEMISNMNCGHGVPCTVKAVAGKRMQPPPMIDRSNQYTEEFRSDLEDIASGMDSAIEKMTALFEKTGATKKEKESVLKELQRVKQDIGKNLPFVEKQFGRCINKATDDAKRNIEGHMMNVALSAARNGLVTKEEGSSLIENQSLKMLGGE